MIVILHGWSDSAKSFERLANELVEEGVEGDIRRLRLGDYISMDDAVTFDDLIEGMRKAWEKEGLPTSPRSVDLVAHSTGALVARHWMTTYWKPATNPIHRFLMLAPANFGSPIAHKGRSFVGRVVKGFNSEKMFQTGSKILKGLELASPFTWGLAVRDRFGDSRWYGPQAVLGTVLVGTAGYTGISAAANENGSDGTVRVSTANLNPKLIEMDFVSEPNRPTLKEQSAQGEVAFARVAGENHSTVAWKDRGPRNAATIQFAKAALTVDDANFPAHCKALQTFSEAARTDPAILSSRFSQPYQNTVVRVADHFGAPVCDYFVEFFMKLEDGRNRPDDSLTRKIQESVIATVHAYEDLSAYRSFLVNVAELTRLVNETGRPLYISITAIPDVAKTKTVGYRTFGYNDIGSIKILPEHIDSFFAPDRTLLVDLRIRREQEERLFTFKKVTS